MIQITRVLARGFFFRATVYTNHGPKLGTVSNQDSSGFELRAGNADLLVFRFHLKIDRFTQHASNRQPNFCWARKILPLSGD